MVGSRLIRRPVLTVAALAGAIALADGGTAAAHPLITGSDIKDGSITDHDFGPLRVTTKKD